MENNIFHAEKKEKLKKDLERENDLYQKEAGSLQSASINLHNLRENSTTDIISKSEDYLNSVLNIPKSFEKSISELKYEYKNYSGKIYEAQKIYDNIYAKTLADADPLGWAGGIVCSIVGAYLQRRSNQKFIDYAKNTVSEIRKERNKIYPIIVNVKSVQNSTQKYYNKAKISFDYLTYNAPKDYLMFDEKQKNELDDLTNSINKLSKLLNKELD